MAKQKGIFKIEGTIGDVTFYKSGNEYLVREKGGVDGDRIANDPAFQRTRENGMEFGRAGANGKLLRNSIRILLLNASDRRMVGRLTRDILKVIKMDQVNKRGERVITEGDMTDLVGFEFNARGVLSSTFYGNYGVDVNRVDGEVDVNIPAFVPGISVAWPNGATHLKLISGAAAVDFEDGTFDSDIASTSTIEIGSQLEAANTLSMSLPAATTLPIFVVFGVEFYQEVNGEMYPLKNGAFNALAIVNVDA